MPLDEPTRFKRLMEDVLGLSWAIESENGEFFVSFCTSIHADEDARSSLFTLSHPSWSWHPQFAQVHTSKARAQRTLRKIRRASEVKCHLVELTRHGVLRRYGSTNEIAEEAFMSAHHNTEYRPPRYVNEGENVWIPYRHEGKLVGLRCRVEVAAGLDAKVVNQAYNIDKWMPLARLLVPPTDPRV